MESISYKTFLFEYHHDGGTWMLEVPGTDLDDAKARVKKLPLARPLGELVAKIPARGGLLAKALCGLRNFCRQW